MLWRRSPARVTLVLMLVSGIISSCTDASTDVSAPAGGASLAPQTVQLQPGTHVSGQVNSSIWYAHTGGFVNLGTLNASVNGTVDGNTTPSLLGPATFTTGSSDRAALSSTVSTPSFSNTAGKRVWDILRASTPGQPIRVKLDGPTRTEMLPDGRELRIELSPVDRNSSTATAAYYIDNQLMALNFFEYGIPGRTPTQVDAIHFDGTGGVTAITNHDLTKLETDPRAVSEETFNVATGVQALSGESCATQPIPDPDCEEFPCTRELAVLAGATAAFVAAQIAFDVAVGGCPTPAAPLACPAVVAASSALASATTALIIASNDYIECMQRHNNGGGNGGGSSSYHCETLVLEISYDGGLTWEYLDTVTVCE